MSMQNRSYQRKIMRIGVSVQALLFTVVFAITQPQLAVSAPADANSEVKKNMEYDKLVTAAPAQPAATETITTMDNLAAATKKSATAPQQYLYFTSWQFVRPGMFSYKDPDGKSLALDGSTGDHGARFTPTDIPRGIHLQAQPPAEKIPIPKGQYIPMVFDRGVYKTWYAVSDASPSAETKHNTLYLGYAESHDGVAWSTPVVGLYEYKGSKDNNIVFRDIDNDYVRGWDGFVIFVDAFNDPAERYKMVFRAVITPEAREKYIAQYPDQVDPISVRYGKDGYAICGAVSPDGLHWRNLPEPMLMAYSDTQLSAYYDAKRGENILYYRDWQVDHQGPSGVFPLAYGRRAIARATSKDFRHWYHSGILLVPGADMAPSHHWYGPNKTTLPGLPDQHVMFPFLYKMEDDTMDTHLFSSPDGWVFTEVPGSPVLTHGAPGAPDGCMVVPAGHMLTLPDGRWALPYSGNPIPHKYPRNPAAKRELYHGLEGASYYAVWPKGRLVALECPEEGEFATNIVWPAGTKMFLNAVVSPTGYIRAGLTGGGDIPGHGLADCDPIIALDNIAIPVTWKGDADMGEQKDPILIRFQLRQAKLFGVEFRD